MVIWFDFSVDMSCADTLRIPLASMSKVSHIDLKHAEGRTLDAVEVELTQEVIALGHCTFGLEYLDEYS